MVPAGSRAGKTCVRFSRAAFGWLNAIRFVVWAHFIAGATREPFAFESDDEH
jgi:hypothetical protein